MALLADYTFLDVFWSMLVFFVWVLWFILLFRVIIDIFSRHDIGGGGKVLWILFVILLPFLGVFVYLIAENDGMTQRAMAKAQAQQAQMDEYVRSDRRHRWGHCRRDRQGEAAPRQRRHLAGRVRRDQGQSARVTLFEPKDLRPTTGADPRLEDGLRRSRTCSGTAWRHTSPRRARHRGRR